MTTIATGQAIDETSDSTNGRTSIYQPAAGWVAVVVS